MGTGVAPAPAAMVGSYDALPTGPFSGCSDSGRSVRVRDIATVSWDTKQWSYFARFTGKRAVIVTANQKDGYNILTLKSRVDAAIERFANGLPKRIRLERDEARGVKRLGITALAGGGPRRTMKD